MSRENKIPLVMGGCRRLDVVIRNPSKVLPLELEQYHQIENFHSFCKSDFVSGSMIELQSDILSTIFSLINCP